MTGNARGVTVNVTFWVISGLLFASFLAMAALAVQVATRYRTFPTSKARLFVVFATLAGLWSLASGLELVSPGLNAKIFWSKVQYVSIVFLPPVWLLFVVDYTDTFRRFRRWSSLFFIPSIMTLLVVWSNEWHLLMWANVSVDLETSPVAVFGRGPWFQYVLIPYSYFLLLSALGVLVTALWLSPRVQQGQLWLLLGTQFVPVLANLSYLLRLAPFDLTPLGFAVSSLLLGFGLFRRRLIQQLPIAYRHVFEQMRDGVLVLDGDKKLLNYNREAGRLLFLSEDHLNHTLEEIRPALAPMFAELWEQRQHECRHRSVILEFHVREMTMNGAPQGYILTVEDATERRAQQGVLEQQARELELLDRVRVVVANQLNLSEAMHRTVEAIAEIFGYNFVSLYLLEGDVLVEQHQVGYDNPVPIIPIDMGVIGRVARTGEPALVTNPQEEPDFLYAASHVISAVAVPFTNHERVVGVLCLESTEVIFTEVDLKLMMALSEQIAIAVERARLYEDVSRNEKQLRLLTENMSDLICLHALDGTFTYVSPSSKTLFGYEPFELLGKSPFTFVHPDDLEYVKGQTRQLLEGKTPKPFLQRCRKKDGSYIWVEMFNHPVFDISGDITSVVAVSRDVTERKRMEEQMLEGALLYDALTGLPNRVLFMDRVQQASRRSGRSLTNFALMFLDLDRFKIINDSLGHRAGDTLLVEVSKRIASCIRSGDTAARLGGDEFAVLLETIDETEVKQLAQRIQQSLQLPFTVEGHEVVSSASIGIILGRGTLDPEDLLRRADMAMYQSKAKGRASYTFFDETMHAHLQEQLRLENDLRKALVKSEFEVFYQPIMALTDQRLLGFEALVRWQHPQRGLLLPSSFITVAEDMGLIGELDLWVLREACLQLKRWQEESARLLTMNVNVSARSLLVPDFSERLAGILKETKLEAGRVRLELTESVLMDQVASRDLLAALRSQGVGLMIDDFGTGYSSLSYLHTLPLDALKIDRSFVQEMTAGNVQIVSTIILLAQSLGLNVVAEGIETQEQVRQLQGLGCEVGQGFLFGDGKQAERVKIGLSPQSSYASIRS
jgi:diguanylate cyclase (GGDEF)-like protein/PAS domain S-box-containing protein